MDTLKHINNAILTTLLTFCLLLNLCACSSDKTNVNVALIFSQSEDSYVAQEILDCLNQSFKQKHINAQMVPLYLGNKANPRLYKRELVHFLDTVCGEKPDLVMLYGQTALDYFLHFKAATYKKCPVVFAGVSCVNKKALAPYPHVCGYASKVYLLENLKLIEQLYGNVEIDMFYNRSSSRRNTLHSAFKKLKNSKFDYDHQVLTYLDAQESVDVDTLLAKRTPATRFKGPYISLLPLTALSFRDNLKLLDGLSGTAVYLSLGHLLVDMHLTSLYKGPVFVARNFELQDQEDALGGFFPTLQTEAEDFVNCAAERLNHQPVPQLRFSKPDYVFDERVLEYWNLDEDAIPKGSILVNHSTTTHYKTLIIVLAVFVLGLLIVSLVVLIRFRKQYREQQKKQRLLSLQNERLMLACVGSNVCGWLYRNGKWSITRRKAAKINKFSRTSYRHNDLLSLVHPCDAASVDKLLKKDMGLVQGSMRIRMCASKGKPYVWNELVYTRTLDMENHPVVVGFSYDIQQFKDEEDALNNNRQIIEKADLKQSFLANMTHEIRSPLSTIVALSNLLSSEDANDMTDKERQEMNFRLKDNVDMLLKLLDEILQMSHIETGEMKFSLSVYDVDKLMLDIYQSYSAVIRTDLRFELKPGEDKLAVKVDKLRFTQLFANLLTNANKYTKEGFVEMGYTYFPATSEVLVYVKDSGIGVPKDKQKTIFNYYEKADEYNHGTGIGLSLCVVIANRMKGHMYVKSEYGVGSKFGVVLPCHKIEV